MRLENVILSGRDPKSRWDVDFESNIVTSIKPAAASSTSSDPSSIILPPLCHPHIHLDKAYLLTCHTCTQQHPSHAGADQSPDYTDLTPQDGSFDEALAFTSRAKQRYTTDDLYLRGSQLLATSLRQGVTSCRAFVELDHVTGRSCLEAAIALKKSFHSKVKLQICTFAQDPIFSTAYGEENRRILRTALDDYRHQVEVLGTTPYVEKSNQASLQNIAWAIDTALALSLHLDFHLDYDLDDTRRPMVWDVLRLLKEARWSERAAKGKTIVLGHCSRLTLCSDAEMAALATEIKDSKLPIHFVGLPTSDLFMMGRPTDSQPNSAHRPRGTLQALDMINKFGLSACLSVNNVGNAFTPWGTGDPIGLASMGVGIFQAGTERDANLLFECVSSRARRAIGLTNASAVESGLDDDLAATGEDSIVLTEGRAGELLLISNEEWAACPGHLGIKVPARQRVSIKDIVWDPPEVSLRQILHWGEGGFEFSQYPPA